MELADIIARIESSNNQYAQHFEPMKYQRNDPSLIAMIVKAHDNKISRSTADIYASMSHGLYQIMGFNLWGNPVLGKHNLGYGYPLWRFMTDLNHQREMFNLYCSRSGIAFTIDQLQDHATLAIFAERYNGSGNVAEYSARIMNAIHELQ